MVQAQIQKEKDQIIHLSQQVDLVNERLEMLDQQVKDYEGICESQQKQLTVLKSEQMKLDEKLGSQEQEIENRKKKIKELEDVCEQLRQLQKFVEENALVSGA